MTRGVKSITIPDGVNVAPVIGTITIHGGVSHCKVTCERQRLLSVGAVFVCHNPYPMPSKMGELLGKHPPCLATGEVSLHPSGQETRPARYPHV